MKFSLVLPTLNRVIEVERLFQSLLAQDYEDFEVIVVDQNPDDRLVELIASFSQHFPILHLRESKRGLSHARNIGFLHIQGDIVAFPDDDCLYPDNLLTKVAHFFQNNLQWDGVIGRVYDLDEDKSAFEFCDDDQSQEVDYIKSYYVAVSCGIFLRTHVAKKIAFDETIGLGNPSPRSCGEETDYVFHCLDEGYRFYYDTTLIVRHPNPTKKSNFREQVRREYTYGLGKGYFLATYNLPQSWLRSEYNAPYKSSLSEVFKGNFHRAAYLLVHGIGASLGYRAGLKSSNSNTKIEV